MEIYVLFIRSIAEYSSVAFHSSLTKKESAKIEKIEKIQKTCLKVILGDMFIDYASALEMTGLQILADRRQARCLDFAMKCASHPRNQALFPRNLTTSQHYIQNKEVFQVNFARTEEYKNSTIPFCQRLLNQHYNGK